jgi:hypothetical protein
LKKQSIARKYKHTAINKSKEVPRLCSNSYTICTPITITILGISSAKSLFADLLGDGRVLDVNSMHMYKDTV